MYFNTNSVVLIPYWSRDMEHTTGLPERHTQREREREVVTMTDLGQPV